MTVKFSPRVLYVLHNADRKMKKGVPYQRADHEVMGPRERCVVCERCFNCLFPTVWIFPHGFFPQKFFSCRCVDSPCKNYVCFGHHSVLCMVGAMYLVGCCGCDVFAGVHNDAKPIQCHGGEVMC